MVNKTQRAPGSAVFYDKKMEGDKNIVWMTRAEICQYLNVLPSSKVLHRVYNRGYQRANRVREDLSIEVPFDEEYAQHTIERVGAAARKKYANSVRSLADLGDAVQKVHGPLNERPAEPSEEAPVEDIIASLMPVEVTPEVPAVDEKPAAPVRPATVAQKREIADIIEQQYDVDNERYRADWSDDKVARKLDFPRIWVSTVREFTYGRYDRNEMAEIRGKEFTRLEELINKHEKASQEQYAFLRAELNKLKDRLSFR